MEHVVISSKNFDSILKESISRIKRSASLRELVKDEIFLLSEYELCKTFGWPLTFQNRFLRDCLMAYCYGTSTFNK